MAEEYTYAVARIRALENGLLTDSFIDQLISCQDEKQCLHLLEEKRNQEHQLLQTIL